jgi:hypothetical protein
VIRAAFFSSAQLVETTTIKHQGITQRIVHLVSYGYRSRLRLAQSILTRGTNDGTTATLLALRVGVSRKRFAIY